MSSPGTNVGLSPQQFQELAAARLRATKIRRAVAVATFDGWATAIFAGLTLIGGLFHWLGLVLGAAMAIVALVEFRGAARLRRLNAIATTSLALNQIFLGGMLLAYAVYSIWRSYSHPSLVQLTQLAPEFEHLAKLIVWIVYGTLAAVAIFVQGGTALFYLTRKKHIEAYVRDTPAWIVDAQRAGLPM